MVVFTCAHCGESLQKPRVEKHYYTKCRNNYPDLCCVDCLKDFRGDEYVAHTKCMTEEERYSAKGYVPKPGQNKGERKQTAWIEMVQSVLDENKSLPQGIRYLLERVSQQPNTPRKKPKFINFIRSMDRRAHEGAIEKLWELLSAKLKLLNNQPNPSRNNNKAKESQDDSNETSTPNTEETVENDEELQNGVAENGDAKLSKKEKKEKKKREKYESELKSIETDSKNIELENNVDELEPTETKKAKKRKAKKEKSNDETPEVVKEPSAKNNSEDNVEPVTKKVKKDDAASSFDWQNIISTVLNSKGKPIALKKLQKRVLNEYCVVNNVAEITDRIVKKYEKNLNKMPNVKIVQDKACIVESEE